MLLYRDALTNDELISDSYKQLAPLEMEALKDVAFEVEGKWTVIGGDYGIAVNADEDAEESATGGAAEAAKEIDIIAGFQYQATSFTKAQYQAYIKKYMAEVTAFLTKNKPERVDAFKSGAVTLIKTILSKFNDFEFYITEKGLDAVGESKCHVVLSYYKDGEIAPRFIYMNDGMVEEKC